jgi:adenylate cyclase class IV
MQTEIEAKSLSVDHDTLRVKLRELGATLEQPMRLMRRYNFDFPDGRLRQDNNGWARVRDENGKITMSYKELGDRTLHGTKEVCLTIDSFDNAKLFLESIGMESTSYQETMRESWRLGDLEIELDHWPWTNPYIEIEAPDETAMRGIFAKLDLPYDKAVFGSVEVVYQETYDVPDHVIYDIPTIGFDLPIPETLSSKRREQTA